MMAVLSCTPNNIPVFPVPDLDPELNRAIPNIKEIPISDTYRVQKPPRLGYFDFLRQHRVPAG